MDMYAKKTTLHISNRIKLQEYCLRIIGYLFIAAVVATGIYTQMIPASLFWLIPYALLYPQAVHLLARYVDDRHLRIFYVIKVSADAIHTVCIAALLGFPLIPSLLGLLIISFITLITGGLRLMLPIFAGVLALTAGLWFEFKPTITFETPLLVNLVSLVITAVFICLTSYFVYFQGVKLAKAQRKVQLEQKKYQSLVEDLTKYLSPQLCETILTGKRPAKIANQRKKLTVFFSDIKGFTMLAEELEAEALTDLLNNYLNEMSKIALEHGAIIDKFIGDSIMIFFGDLSSNGTKKDAQAAVSMALAMREHMKVLQRQWRAQGITNPLEIRMGVNTGYCTVGNFGSDERMDYNIIGQEVNLASRLESSAQPGQILISNETYCLTRDIIKAQTKGEITMKGFSRPIEVFEVVDFRTTSGRNDRYIEYELPGFSMLLDTNSIESKDGKQIAYALKHASVYFDYEKAKLKADTPPRR